MADIDDLEIEFDEDADFSTPEPTKKRSTRSKAKPRTQRPTLPQIEKAMSANLKILGMAVSGFDSYDGEVLIKASDEIAKQLVEVAKVSPKTRAMLEGLMSAGAYGGLMTVVTSQVVMPIAVHHGMLPEAVNTMLAHSFDIPVKGNNENTEANATTGS